VKQSDGPAGDGKVLWRDRIHRDFTGATRSHEGAILHGWDCSLPTLPPGLSWAASPMASIATGIAAESGRQRHTARCLGAASTPHEQISRCRGGHHRKTSQAASVPAAAEVGGGRRGRSRPSMGAFKQGEDSLAPSTQASDSTPDSSTQRDGFLFACCRQACHRRFPRPHPWIGTPWGFVVQIRQAAARKQSRSGRAPSPRTLRRLGVARELGRR